MHTKAAILVETKKPLVIDEIEIPPLKAGQVLIKILYSGICHTQLLEVRGHRGPDAFLPHCLGHEGSGIVEETGLGVSKVKAGDNVILSWMKGSGHNVLGSQYTWNGKKVNAGAITTFSHHAIISENRLTVIPKDFPMKQAALIGCALPTGLGAVFNTAKPSPGQSIAIFGCGGIGLSAIQGAKIAGCLPIIAVDIHPEKLAMAKKMGATHLINSSEQDPVPAIQKICELDFAIESSGKTKVMDQALQSVRNQGGTAVILGNAHQGELLFIDPKQLNAGKRLLGSWGGENIPDIHFPRYCRFIKEGFLQLDPFSSHTYSLDEADKALEDLENGKVLRPLLDMSL
ncbi:MAG: zinc-binding dehydrogenase [Chlamydiota bacterium]